MWWKRAIATEKKNNAQRAISWTTNKDNVLCLAEFKNFVSSYCTIVMRGQTGDKFNEMHFVLLLILRDKWWLKYAILSQVHFSLPSNSAQFQWKKINKQNRQTATVVINWGFPPWTLLQRWVYFFYFRCVLKNIFPFFSAFSLEIIR